MSTEKHGEDAAPGEEVQGWFAGRLPAGWFTETPEVLVDREEITVVGPLGGLDVAADASPAAQAAAAIEKGLSEQASRLAGGIRPDQQAEIAAMEEAAAVIAEAQAAEADALLRALAAGAEAAEAEAASGRIQSAAAADAVRALITAGLVEEAAAHEAVTALIAARLIVDAADQVAAESIAEDLATISAADEVAAEATGEAGERIRAASITVAEAQVLRYLPKQLPFSVIADKLGISRSAAKERAERLYKRLGVHSRADAVSRARALGLLRG